MPPKPDSQVSKYLQLCSVHFSSLAENKKISQENKSAFLEDFLGCSKTTHKSWYSHGIRKVYYSLLWSLDELKKYKERAEELEKQLSQITKQ